MTLSPPDAASPLMEISTSIANARRNLAQRIERFLAAKQDGVPTAGEAPMVREAPDE